MRRRSYSRTPRAVSDVYFCFRFSTDDDDVSWRGVVCIYFLYYCIYLLIIFNPNVFFLYNHRKMKLLFESRHKKYPVFVD
jgi:hypothetical protein